MRWTTSAAAVAAAALAAAALGKDAVSYPEGVSTQTFGDHTFELAVPKAADANPPYSLLILLASGVGVDPDFVPFTKDGYVVCAPKQKLPGGMWATSETKDILDFADHLAGVLQIGKGRSHVLTYSDHRGFASFVAFDKRATFVSFSLVDTVWQGQSPPADAKKRIGVLSMGKSDTARGDPAGILKALAGKVRTLEHREDDGPFTAYFRYWIGVMEGRFKPGYDLSFKWIADADRPATAPKPGAKDPPPPAAKPALDDAKASAKAKGSAAFVYFWAAEDADKTEAKALQNDVFFDSDVRAAGKDLFAVKLDRAKYQEAFSAFGLKTTPAVVVVDHDFNVLDRFEGAIPDKALVKSLTKAAAAAAKPR